ncbi:MAG: HAMP domain-containing protein [Chloroflexota bacterium]
MKITTRLVLSFLLISLLPLALLAIVEQRIMDTIRQLAVDESSQALRQLGQASIHQKALDVARQVDLYLQAHPQALQASPQDWANDAQLSAIGVQPVGETGYTAVYDQRGVVYAHANPAMLGRDMHELSASLPAFWAIFEASLDGSPSASYYDWQDPDGSLRQKYMSCVPVGSTPLRVAATTYIDEFDRPARQTGEKINALFTATNRYLLVALLILGILAALVGFRLALGISRPIQAVAEAAARVEAGDYAINGLGSLVPRRDELGQLARLFRRMAGEVQHREQHLQAQVHELRIEIDEVKKGHQVAEITESEYFQRLLEKVDHLRSRRTPSI